MDTATKIFNALADETRLRIMALLIHGGELCVCDLTEALGLPQSTVSRHVSRLKNAGLISSRRQGVWTYYRLSDDPATLDQHLLAALEQRLAPAPVAVRDRTALEEFRRSKNRNCT